MLTFNTNVSALQPKLTPKFQGAKAKEAVAAIQHAPSNQVMFGSTLSELLGRVGVSTDAKKISEVVANPVMDFTTGTISYTDFLSEVLKNPSLARMPHQYEYDMIAAAGTENIEKDGEKLIDWKFFSQARDGRHAIAGNKFLIHHYMQSLRSATDGSNAIKRLTSIVGPAGGAKSTMINFIKRGMEAYSRTDAGALYTFAIDLNGLPEEMFEDKLKALKGGNKMFVSPMNENPLWILPDLQTEGHESLKDQFYGKITEAWAEQAAKAGKARPEYPILKAGPSTPASQEVINALVNHYSKDTTDVNQILDKVFSHIKVKKYQLSETGGVGISTYNAGDEKTSSTEDLTGSNDLLKQIRTGKDKDPLVFNYDGILTRGTYFTNLEEIYRWSDNAMFDSLLSACEEKMITPPGQRRIPHYGHLVGTANIPNWNKIKNNKELEALRSRTNLIYAPYNTEIKDEVKIYEDYYAKKFADKGIHVAPRTFYVASLWAIMTRLNKDTRYTPLEKARLYNYELIKGLNESDIIQMKREARAAAAENTDKMEALKGIGPRGLQNAFDSALGEVEVLETGVLDPLMILDLVRRSFEKADTVEALSTDQKKEYIQFLDVAKGHAVGLIKKDVYNAMSGSREEKLQTLKKYIQQVSAFTNQAKSRPATGTKQQIDEAFMKKVETKLGLSDASRINHRKDLMAKVGNLATDSRNAGGPDAVAEILLDNDPGLAKAVSQLLAENYGATKLPTLGSDLKPTKEQQELLDTTIQRLINEYGYDKTSAMWAIDIARPDNLEYKAVPIAED